MKYQKTIFVLLVLVVIFTYSALQYYAKTSPQNVQVVTLFDPLNATYSIENKSVALVNGSSADNQVVIFRTPVAGDINGDGINDAAIVVTQNLGGSGTFFYVASAINVRSGTFGTNAILLGDRIAPQNTLISNGQIIVNYADRKPGEPMTASPSVGVSKYFKVMGNTLSESHPISLITNRKWKWTSTKMNDGATIIPKNTTAFSILFKDDQTVSGTTDCNGFGGAYTADNGKLAFGQLASTLMYCVDSQEADYLKGINAVESYVLTTDNKLVLQLKMDSGMMMFE